LPAELADHGGGDASVSFERYRAGGHQSANLVDILDRVLDKGLVVAGDIRISLANVELLTIRIRLLVCSIDKAEQIGLNWWRYDQSLVHPPESNGRQEEVIGRLEARIAELESQLQQRATDAPAPTTRPSRRRG
jgi:gas vesicle protein GvpA/GvpJ/GvpM family